MKLNPTFTQSLLKFEMDQFYLSVANIGITLPWQL